MLLKQNLSVCVLKSVNTIYVEMLFAIEIYFVMNVLGWNIMIFIKKRHFYKLKKKYQCNILVKM